MCDESHQFDSLLNRLAGSRFRRRFTLGAAERRYLSEHGLDIVCEHARRFIVERLAPAQPKNDGRQTPWRGHPGFIAQHATATCCRKCLDRWHQIPRGRPLDDDEIDYVTAVIEAWLRRQGAGREPTQPRLFE